MPKKQLTSLIGRRFTRWEVIGNAGRIPNTRIQLWTCKCDCGTIRDVRYNNLLRRDGLHSKSCGCLKAEVDGARFRKHGLRFTREYSIWLGMIQRCTNSNTTAFKHYGGRGISVCPSWRQSFTAFLDDVGKRPSARHSLDRIDNSGNYEPGNTRWVTIATQANNRRNNLILNYNGKSLTVAEWGRETSLGAGIIRDRLRLGWTPEKALTTPVMNRGKKK